MHHLDAQCVCLGVSVPVDNPSRHGNTPMGKVHDTGVCLYFVYTF
jgi:hypothetical protein